MLVYQRVNTIQLYTTLIFYSAPFVNVGVQLLEECCASFEPKPMQNARTSSAPFLDWFHARAQEVEHQGRRQRWIWWLMSWRQLSLIILLIKSDDIHNIRNQTSLYKLRLYISSIYHQYITIISPLYHHDITIISLCVLLKSPPMRLLQVFPGIGHLPQPGPPPSNAARVMALPPVTVCMKRA